jgi:hypothetical protein
MSSEHFLLYDEMRKAEVSTYHTGASALVAQLCEDVDAAACRDDRRGQRLGTSLSNLHTFGGEQSGTACGGRWRRQDGD